jgi:uncharacterized protein YcbX
MARENALSYSVSANGLAGDWYWEVTSDGNVIARGLSPTTVRARADALKNAASRVEPQSEDLSQSRGDAFPSLNFA